MVSYEEIHKQARLLEGELDLKLTHLNKICSIQKTGVHGAHSEINVLASTGGIQDLIRRLDLMNEQMTESTPDVNSIPVKHSMQRHSEILQDYRKEFCRIQENFKMAQERRAMSAVGIRKVEESALDAERDHLLSSEILIDGQLNLAQETRLQLLSQRKSMKKLHTHLRSFYHRFPVLNDLIRKIELSKQKRFAVLVIIALLILAIIHAKGIK